MLATTTSLTFGRGRYVAIEPCLGYVIAHPDAVVVVDTGMGSHPDLEAHYRPLRRPLGEALATAGVSVADVQSVVNCHLHFDHCGGNPQLGGRPIFTQRVELEAARGPDYTLPELPRCARPPCR
jgi:N-acyl homoserine lactone hydrolase